jgi:hypothetical protein
MNTRVRTMINIRIMRNDFPLDGRCPYHRWRTGARTRLPHTFSFHDSRMYMLPRWRTWTSPSLYKPHNRARTSPPHDRWRPDSLTFSLDNPRPRTLAIEFAVTRRLAPGSVNNSVLNHSGRAGAPVPMVHIPCFHVPLAENHGASFRPSSVFSQERGATKVEFGFSSRRTSCHDPGGAVIRVFKARVRPTRRGIVIPFFKVGRPHTTLRHDDG